MNRVVGEIPLTTLPVEEAPPAAGLEPERARVLLVDDDERNLLAVATVLEDLGDGAVGGVHLEAQAQVVRVAGVARPRRHERGGVARGRERACPGDVQRRPAAGRPVDPCPEAAAVRRRRGHGQFSRSTSIAWPMPPATHIDSIP